MSARDPILSAAGFMAVGVLPLVHLVVMLGTGQLENTDVSLMLSPLLFAVLAWFGCRALDVGRAWAAVNAVGCAAACWFVAVVAGLFDSLFLPW